MCTARLNNSPSRIQEIKLWYYELVCAMLVSMSKFMKIFFVFPVILFLSFSSIVCCCFLTPAEAENSHRQSATNTPEHPQGSHCDSHDQQGDSPSANSSSQHQCECPEIQTILAKNSDLFSLTNTTLYFLNHWSFVNKSNLTLIPDTHKLLTEHSPPYFSSLTIPLYIKNSNLRI